MFTQLVVKSLAFPSLESGRLVQWGETDFSPPSGNLPRRAVAVSVHRGAALQGELQLKVIQSGCVLLCSAMQQPSSSTGFTVLVIYLLTYFWMVVLFASVTFRVAMWRRVNS